MSRDFPTISEYRVMTALHECESYKTVKELQSASHFVMSATGVLLNRLRTKGWVYSKQTPNTNKLTWRLTEDGESLIFLGKQLKIGEPYDSADRGRAYRVSESSAQAAGIGSERRG